MRKIFAFLFIACAVSAWADPIVVTTEDELWNTLSETADNVQIVIGNDITLTKHVTVWHSADIDLNGKTLHGDKTQGNGTDYKCIFIVAPSGNMTLHDGTLADADNSGSKSDEHGGGAIVNKGTATLTNVTITRCIGKNGGAVKNNEGATLTISNCTLTDNTSAEEYGGAITNLGTLALNGCIMTGNTARRLGGAIMSIGAFSMQGDIRALDNTNGHGNPDNIYVVAEAPITISGPLTVGDAPSIGVYSDTQGAFTSGYSTYNNGVDPATIFTTDLPGYLTISLDNNEAALTKASETAEYYVERYWDGGSKTVKSRIKLATSYTELTGGSFPEDAGGGWYVVKGNVSYDHMSFSTTTPIDILLCDGARLNLKYLRINQYCNLHIYGQRNDEGALYAMSDEDNMPGIGSGGIQYQNQFRTIEIHGGMIQAQGGDDAPGIGAGGEAGDLYDEIKILGGYVEAQGGSNAPGIGRGPGYDGDDYGEINIYGGTIVARGGADGAGIGGGDDQPGGITNIYGGTIFARGDDGAGIGGGDCGNGGWITIHGGDITAEGWTDGSSNGAGIGGGVEGNGGTIVINGGTIHAHGGLYAAGIGGGEDASAGDITINGGIIDTEAGMDNPGTGYRAIGPGEGCDNYGKLTLGDDLMVKSERKAAAAERKAMCWYRVSVHIEPCTHPNIYYTSSGCTADDTHTMHCEFCNHTETEYHHFEDGVCTVCGVSASAYSVTIYEPQAQPDGSFDGQTYGVLSHYLVAPNSTFVLPTCQTQVRGLQFTGWATLAEEPATPYVSPYTTTGEALDSVGKAQTVTQSISYVARYKVADITLYDDQPNGATLAEYDGATVSKVTLAGRVFNKNNTWQPLTLPFSLSAEELAASPLAGCTLKRLDTDSTYNDAANHMVYLYFKDTTAIAAGVPYIIRWESGDPILSPEFTNVTLTNHTADARGKLVIYRSIYSPQTFASANKMVLYFREDGVLVYPDGEQPVTVGACRAYFRLTNLQEEDPEAEWTISTNLDGEQGIDQTTNDKSQMTNKVIYNGLLFIERNGKIYNAQGAEIQ